MVILFQMTIGQLIKDVLGKKGISQIALADKIGLTGAQVSRIISGDRNTSIDTLLLIADALQIDRDVIIKVAAGLSPEPEEDEWVKEQMYKLEKIKDNPVKQSIAANVLSSLLDQESLAPAKRLQPKRSTK